MLIETKKYIERLTSAGVPNPRSEVAKIIDFVRGTKGEDFSLSLRIEVNEQECAKIEALIAKRAERIPLSRLLERVPFVGIKIETGEGVFAPTPETENMIDHACLLLEGKGALRILDLGSGSGCLLLALLKAFPQATGVGIDQSEIAIALAKRNAAINSLQDRADFQLGDWSNGVNEAFDFVISNPPRVATEDIAHLLPEMRDHDPRLSLDGGSDGLKFYRKLAEDFHRIAKKNAFGLFQVGPMYAHSAERLFHDQGFQNTEIKLNYLECPSCLLVVNDKA